MARIKDTRVVQLSPRALIMGEMPYVGVIMRAFQDSYDIPAVAAEAVTLEILETRLDALLRKYPSIELIVLSLYGFDKPKEVAQLVVATKKFLIVIVPLRKNDRAKTLTPASLGILPVPFFEKQRIDCIRKVARAARFALKITAPIHESAVSLPHFYGGGIPHKPRDTGLDFEADPFETDDKFGDPYADDSGATRQTRHLPSEPKETAPGSRRNTEKELLPSVKTVPTRHAPCTLIASSSPIAQSLPKKCEKKSPRQTKTEATKFTLPMHDIPSFLHPTKKELKMAANPSKTTDITAIRNDVDALMRRLFLKVDIHTEALAEMKQVADVLHASSGKLREKLAGAKSSDRLTKAAGKARNSSVKTSVNPPGAKTQGNHTTQADVPRKDQVSISIKGKDICLGKSVAGIMKYFVEKQGFVVKKSTLRNGSSDGNLHAKINFLRGKLVEEFGPEAKGWIRLHHGKGYSFEPTVH